MRRHEYMRLPLLRTGSLTQSITSAWSTGHGMTYRRQIPRFPMLGALVRAHSSRRLSHTLSWRLRAAWPHFRSAWTRSLSGLRGTRPLTRSCTVHSASRSIFPKLHAHKTPITSRTTVVEGWTAGDSCEGDEAGSWSWESSPADG